MEVPVKGRKQIDVTMKAASVLLDEVVAIGYATVKRKDLTGSRGFCEKRRFAQSSFV